MYISSICHWRRSAINDKIDKKLPRTRHITIGRGTLHTKFTFSIVDTVNRKRFISIDSEESEFCV